MTSEGVIISTTTSTSSSPPVEKAAKDLRDTPQTRSTVGGPPVIDLQDLSEDQIISKIAEACQTFGFFQITSHGISADLIESFQDACRHFFQDVSSARKDALRRNQRNARGFFDDELTQQKVDWKQCLDVGVPGSRDWSLDDSDERNACLDGYNQFPNDNDDDDDGSSFRSIVVEYFDECAKLSQRIASYMAQGLLLVLEQQQSDDVDDSSWLSVLQQLSDDFLRQLQETHTSYLRINYYPPCDPQQQQDKGNGPGPLGISPHKDAGFLTVLLQDVDCHSLQVWDEARQDWCTVVPAGPHALTVNTGDMAQVWSNGLYKAPLHRVLTHESKVRYSAPFFYNPGYDMWVAPVTTRLPTPQASTLDTPAGEDPASPPSLESGVRLPMYYPVLWGYFRAVRFAGDLTDLGVEIQISHFEVAASSSSSPSTKPSTHVDKQRRFAQLCDFRTAFSVDAYRELLQE